MKLKDMITLMNDDEKMFIVNSFSRQVGLERLSIENLVQLEVRRVRDPPGFSQQVNPILTNRMTNQKHTLTLMLNL